KEQLLFPDGHSPARSETASNLRADASDARGRGLHHDRHLLDRKAGSADGGRCRPPASGGSHEYCSGSQACCAAGTRTLEKPWARGYCVYQGPNVEFGLLPPVECYL